MFNGSISIEEKKHLRELAKKQLNYANLPIMKERERNWYKHNDLQGTIPMIHVETLTFENDLLPSLTCTSLAGKEIELTLLRNILNHEFINDDRVVPDYYGLFWDIKVNHLGFSITKKHSKDSQGRDLGHHFNYQLNDISKDFNKINKTIFSVDRVLTQRKIDIAEDVLGDILPIKLLSSPIDISLSQKIVHLMGMETMIYSLIDYPDEFHKIMVLLTDGYLDYIKWQENEGLLLLNNGNDFVPQGTFGFSTELPGEGFEQGLPITVKNTWGYMDSQETVSISPDMFGEFFFPHYEKLAKFFGLVNYGCCEPVHGIWNDYISKILNIRKVSISPWCDESFMGEALQKSNIIFHRKPSPNYVGVGKTFDEEGFRKHICKTVKAAKGCKLEFSFRDIYTLEGDITKPKRSVQITREEIEKYY